ncbi:hypothetical protein [Xanthomonas massiliensis]|uniref:hypothetical protein n=1 Tax=Xanthomonas massiliensis TaxID=1720302 RepID=UPI001365AC3D|nr:hypothetical protein [Xanthomonas massiliensis]
MDLYTIPDLEKAKTEREAIEARWDNYSGNNPNKFHSDRNAAKAKVDLIEAHLKCSGDIPLSEHEIVERELDHLFPEARSKEVVEHKGVRYQRRFTPAEHSRSGNVTRWHKSWVAVVP